MRVQSTSFKVRKVYHDCNNTLGCQKLKGSSQETEPIAISLSF